MRIKFVNPRMNSRPVDTQVKFRLLPPQSFIRLAAVTPDHHTLELCDENLVDCDLDDRPDLVAITLFVATARRGYAIADAYRARGVPVVVGGLHATCVPEEARLHADVVVVGEGDRLWPQLLEDMERGEFRPFYRNEGPVDLSELPVARVEVPRARSYASVKTLRTSRGCPFRCRFCYQPSFYPTRGVRHRCIDAVVEEIRGHGGGHIMFLDDNLVGDRPFSRRLLEALAPLGITWSGAASADVGNDPDLLKLAHDSGCRSLFVGFESIRPDNLDDNHKPQHRVLPYEASVEAMHDAGIMVNGSFIFGMDHDTPDVFADTVEWITRNRVETATFHILTPYPGTPLFEELQQQGRIVDRNWDHYNTAHAVFEPRRMTRAQLEQGYRWAYRNVYSWPNVVKRAPTHPDLKLPYWAFVLGYKKLAPIMGLLSRMGLFRAAFDLGTRTLLARGAPARIDTAALEGESSHRAGRPDHLPSMRGGSHEEGTGHRRGRVHRFPRDTPAPRQGRRGPGVAVPRREAGQPRGAGRGAGRGGHL